MRFDPITHIAPLESIKNKDEAIGHLIFLQAEKHRHLMEISACKFKMGIPMGGELNNEVRLKAYTDSWASAMLRHQEDVEMVEAKIKKIKDKWC